MRRNTIEQDYIYSFYAIYDDEITSERPYKISYCKRTDLKKIKYYFKKLSERRIEIIYKWFSFRFSYLKISDILNYLDSEMKPIIIHKYSHESNRMRIKKAMAGTLYNKIQMFDENGIATIQSIFASCGELFRNEPVTINELQHAERFQNERNKKYIPCDFYRYGLKITDLPKDLQQKYIALTWD